MQDAILIAYNAQKPLGGRSSATNPLGTYSAPQSPC